MGFGDPLPQSRREAELHAIYLDKARERVSAAVDRAKAERSERRYSALHERESMRRMRIASQMEIARKINPKGGFWYVDDSAREHCATCAARGGRNYTWDQLDRIDPTENHAGCRCSILPALTHGEWAGEYNPLTEALIIQMIRRGKGWVPVARDSDSRFPQRFASTDGSGVASPGPPTPKNPQQSGPKKVDAKTHKGLRYSSGNYLAKRTKKEKAALAGLGSVEIINDLIGGRPGPIKKEFPGLEDRVHPARVPTDDQVKEVADMLDLRADRALLRLRFHRIREMAMRQELTPGEAQKLRDAIEKQLSKPASLHPRSDRMPKEEVAPEPEAPKGVQAVAGGTDYAVPFKPKKKPRNAQAQKRDDLELKIEKMVNDSDASPQTILAALGGHVGMGIGSRDLALGQIKAVIARMKERERDQKAADAQVAKNNERTKKRIATSKKALRGQERTDDSEELAQARKRIAETPIDQVSELSLDMAETWTAGVDPAEQVSLVRQSIKDRSDSIRTNTDPIVAKHRQGLLDDARKIVDEELVPLSKKGDSTATDRYFASIRVAQFLVEEIEYAKANDPKKKRS